MVGFDTLGVAATLQDLYMHAICRYIPMYTSVPVVPHAHVVPMRKSSTDNRIEPTAVPSVVSPPKANHSPSSLSGVSCCNSSPVAGFVFVVVIICLLDQRPLQPVVVLEGLQRPNLWLVAFARKSLRQAIFHDLRAGDDQVR